MKTFLLTIAIIILTKFCLSAQITSFMYKSNTHAKTSIELASDGHAVWTMFGAAHSYRWRDNDSQLCIYDTDNVCAMFHMKSNGGVIYELDAIDTQNQKHKYGNYTLDRNWKPE